MFRFLICVCWQIGNKNMSRLTVRHCSRLYKSRFKNIQATERKVQGLWSSIDRKLDSTNQKSQKINVEFNSSPSQRKRLEFQSNTSKYKRITLTTFWWLLEDLWVTLVRSMRFCNLLTLQVSTKTRSAIKCWWNLVATTRTTTSDLNFWVRSQSHIHGSLCLANPREKSP